MTKDNPIKQEALKLALEALDNLMYWDNGKPDYDEAREAITAIKAALAQPARECPNLKNCEGACFQCEYFNAETGKTEYPAPLPVQEPVARVLQIIKELRPAIKPMEGMGKGKTTEEWFDILVKEIERIQPAQQEALYGMNQDDWKDVVAAIAKVRDGRGIYLGCRPADVFQDWFLALGTAKVKEKNNA